MQEEAGKKRLTLFLIFLRTLFLLYFYYRYFRPNLIIIENKQLAFYILVFLAFWDTIIMSLSGIFIPDRFLSKLKISRKKVAAVIVAVDLVFVFSLAIKFGFLDAILALTFPILELGFESLAPRITIAGITFIAIVLSHGYKGGFDFAFLKSHEVYFSTFYLFVLLGWSYTTELYSRQITQSKMLVNLLEIGTRLAKALTYEKVFEIFSKIIQSIFHYSGFAMYLLEEGEPSMLRVRAVDSPYSQPLSDCSIEIRDSVLSLSAKEKRAVLVEDLLLVEEVVIPKERHLRSIAVMPIIFEGKVLGVFFVAHSSPGFLMDEDLRILSILANHAAICLRNVELHEHASLLAITDSLSGLYTQRYFLEQLDNFLIRVKHESKQLSVIILDVDFFKQVNDTYGHPQGDLLLRQMSGIIKEAVRNVDLAARYGGDEFCVILFDTDKTAGIVTAERIRAAVEQYEFVLKGQIVRITISGGVATYPEDCQTRKDLIQKADDFLYEAKQSGRNKVCAG